MSRSILTKSLILLAILCVAFYFLLGCATPMQMPAQEFSQIEHNEGIVVGSVLMKGGKDILGRKSWRLNVEGIDPNLKDFSIDVELEGEEAVFVTKMLAGEYRFTRLFQPGFSTFYADLDVPFTVHPGKTVYIGRLVIEFSGMLVAGSKFSTRVEDARVQALASAEKTHGNIVRDAVTDLMGKDRILASIKIPQTFEKTWYRPGKRDLSLRAYSHSGTLTIGKEAFEFNSKEEQLNVPYSSILDLRWGTVSGDRVNEWAILTYRVGGEEKVAAFKDGRLLGHGPDSKKIYMTFKKAFADFTASEANKDLKGAWKRQPDKLTYINTDLNIKVTFPDDTWLVATKKEMPTKKGRYYIILTAVHFKPRLIVQLDYPVEAEDMTLDKQLTNLVGMVSKIEFDKKTGKVRSEEIDSTVIQRKKRQIGLVRYKLKNIKVLRTIFIEKGRLSSLSFTCDEGLFESNKKQFWAIVDSYEYLDSVHIQKADESKDEMHAVLPVPKKKKVRKSASLIITCNNNKAVVFLSQEGKWNYKGKVPCHLNNITPGSYGIQVEGIDGYGYDQIYKKTIHIHSGETVRMEVKLESVAGGISGGIGAGRNTAKIKRSKTEAGAAIKTQVAVIPKDKVDIKEPWTGIWKVESTSIEAGGQWGLKQHGKTVVSTKDSMFEIKGKVNGNQLNGRIINRGPVSSPYPFVLNISPDGQSFEGKIDVYQGTATLKGKRKE